MLRDKGIKKKGEIQTKRQTPHQCFVYLQITLFNKMIIG